MAYIRVDVDLAEHSKELLEEVDDDDLIKEMETRELAYSRKVGLAEIGERLLAWADQLPPTSNMACEMRVLARELLPPIPIPRPFNRMKAA